MRALGIDFGTKRIGIALSDESQTLAREYAIYNPKQFWQAIEDLLAKEMIGVIVLGLPLNMSGQPTAKTEEVYSFKDQLAKITELPIEYMDERLSSVMASHIPGGRKDIDSLAAQIILQNYLDKNKN